MTTTTLVQKNFPMDVFGFNGTGMHVQGFESCSHPNVPMTKPEYQFRRETLRDVINFIDCSFGDGLFIHGPTGCGKTSLVEQVCARLNYPVQSFACGGSTEFADLVGQWVLIKGDTVWMDGCLTKAMREGQVLILNEIDLVDPSQLANLNAVMEGSPLVISQLNGEIIHPHPNFRVVATANSNGSGDSSGLYSGVMRQNLAFMDRFICMTVDYPDKEIEMAILSKIATKLPSEIHSKMIELANKVRTIFKGDNEESNIELSITFSTRTLMRWAIQTQRNQGHPSALSYALNMALLNRCSDNTEIEAINDLAVSLFGDYFITSTD